MDSVGEKINLIVWNSRYLKILKVLVKRKTKRSEFVFEEGLPPAGYYWRVVATNDSKREVISETGRFVLLHRLRKSLS